MRTCNRCRNSFEPPDPTDFKTNICGNCADDLRAEEDTTAAQAQADGEVGDKKGS